MKTIILVLSLFALSSCSYKLITPSDYPKHPKNIVSYTDSHYFVSHFQGHAELETTKELIRKDSVVYNKSFNVIKIITRMDDGFESTQTFNYDTKNRLIGNVLRYRTHTSETKYFYEGEKLVKEVVTDSNWISEKTYTYPNLKREVITKTILANKISTGMDTVNIYLKKEKYNAHGLLIQFQTETIYMKTNEKISNLTKYEYNDNDLIISMETHVNEKLAALNFYTYRYDAFNNWIARSSFSSPRNKLHNTTTHRHEHLSSVTFRKIVYD